MVVNKPTIIIYTNDPDQEFLHEICSGIEEEGLLYEIHERAGELDDLAHEAAEDSMLGSGIGMSGQRIAMQMRRLPKGHNVFELNAVILHERRQRSRVRRVQFLGLAPPGIPGEKLKGVRPQFQRLPAHSQKALGG